MMPNFGESQRLISAQVESNITKHHGSFQSGGARRPTTSSSSSSISLVKDDVNIVVSGSNKQDTAFSGEVRPTLDDKASLAIVLFNVLLVDTARGIFFPTLWAHVQNLGGDEIILGYCVGAFSLGRTLMSPIFGKMSTKYGYRRVLMISTGLVVVGSLAYIMATTSLHVFISQVMLGIGSGTLGVTRAYVADKTTPEQRTPLLAYTTAVQYCGFTCMPIVGGLFSHLLGSAKIPVVGQVLFLTQFTAPAFFLIVMAFALFNLLYFVFKDGVRKPTQTELPGGKLSECTLGISVSQAGLTDVNSDVEEQSWPAAEIHEKNSSGENYVCSLEGVEAGTTVGQYIALSDDKEGQRQSVPLGENIADAIARQSDSAPHVGERYGGYASVSAEEQVATGVNTKRQGFFCLRLPSKGDMLIYGGFLLNVSTKGTISCFETLGAEYAMTRFDLSSAQAGTIFATFGAIGVVSLLSMRLLCRYFNDVQLVLGGVSLMIFSCAFFVGSPEGRSGLYVFLLAVFLLYALGYPIGHTAVLGLFSKVVGAQPQGALMGWFGSAGALARTFSPVLAGALTAEFGSVSLFVFLVTILSATFALLFVFREPYLECVAISDSRKKKEKRSSPTPREPPMETPSPTSRKPVATIIFK